MLALGLVLNTVGLGLFCWLIFALAVYAVPRISQVQLMYRARLVTDDVSAGPESLEVGLFEFDRIPWDDIAFPSVRWALHQFQESRHLESFAAYTNPPGETGDF